MFFDTTKGAKCDPYAPFWFADDYTHYTRYRNAL